MHSVCQMRVWAQMTSLLTTTCKIQEIASSSLHIPVRDVKVSLPCRGSDERSNIKSRDGRSMRVQGRSKERGRNRVRERV